MSNNINELLAPFANLHSIMAKLMQLSNTPVILFRGYTPAFNDGDACTHYTEYFDVPGRIEGDTYGTLNPDGSVNFKHTYDEDEDEDGEGVRIQPIVESTLPQEVGSSTFYSIFFEHVLGTNCEGSITLQEDGTLKIVSESYYCE